MREIIAMVSVPLPVIRMHVQGHKMYGGSDLFFLQGVDKIIPGNTKTLKIQLNHIQMPGMFKAGTAQRSLNFRQFAERIVIGRGDSSAGRPESARFPELFDADRCGDICLLYTSDAADE